MIKKSFAGATGYLSKQSRPFLISLGLILVGLIGAADYVTGTELSISIFYLLPISLVTWLVSRPAGFFLSIVSVAVELATDIIVGHMYSNPIVPYWNGAVQLSFFLVVVSILSALRIEYDKTVKLNMRLQETLGELEKTKDQLEQKAQQQSGATP